MSYACHRWSGPWKAIAGTTGGGGIASNIAKADVSDDVGLFYCTPWRDGERSADSSHRSLHPPDHVGIVGLAEDRRTGDEGVGARCRYFRDVFGLHPAIDLQPDRLAAAVDAFAHAAQLVQRRGDERLAAEARIDRHQQHH